MPMCSYCGKIVAKTEWEHVFPSNLYPTSRSESKIQRLTIRSCSECNRGWSDDEAHFRNVLVMSGDHPNPARQELWAGPISRSFYQPDAIRRIDDLLIIIRPTQTDSGERHKIYPAEDPRVLRVIRKVIRGLASYHRLFPYVPDENVWADVLRYEIPSQFMSMMTYHHREPDIAEYWYAVLDSDEIHSAWLLRFFETAIFIGTIDASVSIS